MRMMLERWTGIEDMKTSQWFELHKVMAKEMLKIIFFFLVRLLLLFFDFLQSLPLWVLLYAERVVRWMF
jgi:hypothetical protein